MGMKLNLWRESMSYSKPQVVAQNAATGSFAAGCPEKAPHYRTDANCRACEVVK